MIGIDTSKIITSFESVLKSLVNGDEYKKSPPNGPAQELPSLSVEELTALKRTTYGEDLDGNDYSYEKIKLIEDPQPIQVHQPTLEDLKHINVCGIDGSSQRIERSAFYFILARAAIVEFRYSIKDYKPYFYNKLLDSSAVVWVDGNVFSPEINLATEQILSSKSNKESVNILRKVLQKKGSPFLVKYDSKSGAKSPSSHALGWAVKLQQTLELACLKEIPTDIETVCIKDGPLFSTSISPSDTIEGLNPIFEWKDQVLIACSKKIKDSRLLLEAILQNIDLRNYWFQDQNITDKTLENISTDSILLPRILSPGYRTPLMEAVPRARKRIVKNEPRLMPLTCYYLSKKQPHTYIRIEIPKFMWERNPEKVKKAISIVAWQHELGQRAPLVQLASEIRSQLNNEKNILEKQTIAYLYKNKLDFPKDY